MVLKCTDSYFAKVVVENIFKLLEVKIKKHFAKQSGLSTVLAKEYVHNVLIIFAALQISLNKIYHKIENKVKKILN